MGCGGRSGAPLIAASVRRQLVAALT